MGSFTRRGVDELDLASRRAEDAALRRYQAVHWLDYLAGPLGIPNQPSEKEFISCLRNGLILCNIINKIQPGSVPKVIENNASTQSLPWDCQPLPAYQFFENVRNFLVAVAELKLPVFEASIFAKENLEEGSSTKVVDCILALKDYHEWKQMTGGNGIFKLPRSPLIVHSATRVQNRTPVMVTSDSSRRLDMSQGSDKPMPSMSEIRSLEDTIVKTLAEHMVGTKENMDHNLFARYRSGNVDSLKTFGKILSSCLEEEIQRKFPGMKSSILDHLKERSCSPANSKRVPFSDLLNLENDKGCRACMGKGNCSHWNLVEQQETELFNIKDLLSSVKKEFKSLHAQFQCDLKQIGDQVLEMSTAALGYHKVAKENRILFNMVQDLKGNIRVYCRIRPTCNASDQNIIDYIGGDGSLVVVDPLRPHKEGKKLFQFNRVFGPTATQDEVFRDTQPLIRSVMDGYNVCIFAYGQTGSGKTYTMCGPPSRSANELGISYLALNDLFELSAQRKDIMKYEIQVQMVEIYNEQVRDLLAGDSASTRLEIRSCVSGNSLALPDATMCPVKSTTDVINLMKHGEMNRAVGSTAINVRSSRSHSILTVHVQGEDVVSGSMLCSCLHLVDLAGSERVDKSEVSGDGLREAQYINKSLSCLGDVITALAQKNSHIPYRNSKLTLLLQNSLGGNAKTLMFAHVSPEGDSFGETVSTLKFAQRVSTVELGAAHANKESTEVLELKAELESLKKALACKEVQTPQAKRLKETARTPVEKPKHTTERTPPRSRRLSIENGTTAPVDRSTNYDSKKGAKTPSVVKPRSRRLSLEGPINGQKQSGQIKLPEVMISHESLPNFSYQVAPKSPVTSVLKSPMAKIDTAIKVSSHQVAPKSPVGSVLKSPMAKIDTAFKVSSHQVAPKSPVGSVLKSPMAKIDTAVKVPSHQVTPKSPVGSVLKSPMAKIDTAVKVPSHQVAPKSPVGSVLKSPMANIDTAVKVPSHQVAPKSPVSSVLKSPMVKIDTTFKVPSFQVPKTPEPQIKSRNEVQKVLPTERKITSEMQTPCSTQGKASHIRKTFRTTIGKLINGSEKKNQQKLTEAMTPRNGTSDPKSPISSNARALRRQSLTGVLPEMSRRSSLGGVSTDSCANENRNAKTPPPQVRSSVKLTKRWL